MQRFNFSRFYFAPPNDGGAGDPGAGGKPGDPGAGGTGDKPSPWSPDALPQEDRGWFDNKKYADLPTVVGALRGFEKLHGVPKERLVALPEKPDDPKWGEIHQRLGRPEKEDGYDFGLAPEVAKSPVVQAFQKQFFKHGVPQAAAKEIVAEFVKLREAQVTEQANSFNAASEQAVEKLKAELGAAYEQTIGAARNAAKAYGISKEDMLALEKAWGTEKQLRFFIGLSKAQGEHTMEGTQGGEKTFGALSPAAAQAEIARLLGDKDFIARYTNDNNTIRQQAIAEMERLQKFAAGVAA